MLHQARYTRDKRTDVFNLRGSCCLPDPGDTVVVTTKSGAEKTETVAKILWTGDGRFDDEGKQVWLASRVEKGNR